MRALPRPIRAADLHVVLEKAYRRHARRCGKCGFTLPYPVFRGEDDIHGTWAVDPSGECPDDCVRKLDELVSRMRAVYRLELPDRHRLQ